MFSAYVLGMKRFLALIFCSLFIWSAQIWPAAARQSLPVDTGKVVASLVSSHDSASAGQSFYVALRTQLDDGWHTYWRNPGDSGEPVQMRWTLPEGMTAGEIQWPLPRPIPTGPFVNYGFEGEPIFPVEFTVPTAAKAGDILTLTSEFYYLVCKDVCVPENGSANILIEVGEPVLDDEWHAKIQAALLLTPRKMGVEGAIRKTETSAGDKVESDLKNLPTGDFSDSYFFPYDQGILRHNEPQEAALGADGLRLTTGADYLWDETEMPKIVSGVVTYNDAGTYRGVEVDFAVNGAVDIGAVAGAGVADQPTKTVGGLTLWSAIIGAFIGGLILNLMPCVFPIISLKALSLSKAAHSEGSQARKSAWAYTAGVLATFIALAIILLVIKSAGAQIGWGFQLQSPKVVGLLALLLFIIGLNLLGVFEFGGGLQNTGAGLSQKDGLSGSFFTGALAVVVATPCTAPFMAGAMGYALAQPALVMGLVFIALGFGFALPFLILGYAPALLTRLPKPGPWMVRFKEALAFPMFAAAIWLVWVLSLQAGSDGVLAVLAAGLIAAFAIWLLQRSAIWSKALAGLAVIAALILPLSLSAAGQNSNASTAARAAQAWSQEAVAQNIAEGRTVFVDFTAAWCVTCKVNERLVLKTDAVQEMFTATNTAFFIADWTNKDDVIAAELERYGRAGVPLYLVFTSQTGAKKGKILPQVLTYDVIKDALEN